MTHTQRMAIGMGMGMGMGMSMAMGMGMEMEMVMVMGERKDAYILRQSLNVFLVALQRSRLRHIIESRIRELIVVEENIG